MRFQLKQVAAVIAAAGTILGGVFAWEQGYSNDPQDPGGETNHGITVAVARKNGYMGPMKDMPKQVAEEIYIRDYIEGPGFAPFVEMSPALAEKLIDAGVNTGPQRASRWLQIGLNTVNRDGKDYKTITVDGNIGYATIAAYKGLEKKRGRVEACKMMIKLIDAQQAAHYMELKHMRKFTAGWVINRVGNVPLTKCELKVENYK
jgi:lysozyme family protein